MNKDLLRGFVILSTIFIVSWVFLKIVSVKDTKVISTQETDDLLNTPAADKILSRITVLANKNYNKQEIFYENLNKYSEDNAFKENQTGVGEDDIELSELRKNSGNVVLNITINDADFDVGEKYYSFSTQGVALDSFKTILSNVIKKEQNTASVSTYNFN